MTAPANTDGKFWAYVETAILPDTTGKYRVSVIKFSELYDWREDALAEHIARNRLPARLVGPLTREAYNALPTEGYSTVGGDSTNVEWGPWTSIRDIASIEDYGTEDDRRAGIHRHY